MNGTLYRFFDAAGDLLYVGCTAHGAARLAGHGDKSWWPKVAQATFEHFATRDEAAQAEALAIKEETPRFNRRPGVVKKRRHVPVNLKAGARVRRLRIESGLSPEQLGDIVGLAGQTIRRIEEKGTIPIPNTAFRIAAYFGLRPTDIWPFDDPLYEEQAA